MHVLFLSPTSQLPTIVNQDSQTYAELSAMGYQPIQYGTKRDLQEVERELMEQFVDDLELNQIN